MKTELEPIGNEADYDSALKTIDELMGATEGTPEADALDALVTLVEAYVARRWPVDALDPISIIEHVTEARRVAM